MSYVKLTWSPPAPPPRTLATLRKEREAGVTVAQSGGISIAKAFGGDEEPKEHRRNSGIRHRPLGPDIARSTPAVAASEHTSWELNRRRAAVLDLIRTLEWEFSKHPTKVTHAKLVMLRAQVSELEQRLAEFAELI